MGFIAFFTFFCAPACAQEGYSWSGIHALIRQNFPSVQELSTTTLHQRLQREEVIIIDVRTREEFSVSHLKSAKNYTNKNEIIKAYQPAQELVVYCSVGYRSAKIAQELQNSGFQNVYNLRGSIFMWANQGYPLYRANEEVFKVHPYNFTWGKLLNTRYHAYN